MTFESTWADFGPLATTIANEFGGKFRQYGADREDFLQEFSVWLYKNEDKVQAKVEEFQDEKRVASWVARCLRNQASDYGLDIKAQALGYERGDVYHYSRGELEVLLDSLFDEEAWLNPPQSEGRTAKSPAEGNNWLATLADVAKGFQSLDASDQGLLRDFHQQGFRNKDLAEVWNVTEQTMSARHAAAIKRLQVALGGEAPRPMAPGEPDKVWRGRHPITASQARSIQASYYEDPE